LTAEAVRAIADAGIHLEQPRVLFVLTFLLSNIVSNVPAVMVLLPLATHPMAGALLALASTLAGNLLIVGSIANIIVVDAAERRAPSRLGGYGRLRGASAAEPPVANERVTLYGRPDAARGVQPGLGGLDCETPGCAGLCGGRTRSKSNGFPA